MVSLNPLGFETLYSSTGYSNHVHPLSGLGRIDFVYVKGGTAERIFNESRRVLVFGDLTLPVVKPEHIVALKVFAMKNNPERTLREMADIKELLNLPEINLQEVRECFEKYGQSERYYELVGEKQKN